VAGEPGLEALADRPGQGAAAERPPRLAREVPEDAGVRPAQEVPEPSEVAPDQRLPEDAAAPALAASAAPAPSARP